MALPIIPLLFLAGGALVILSKKSSSGLTFTKVDAIPFPTDGTGEGMVGNGRPSASTRPPGGGTSGGGRAYKDAPTPGYWYKVKERDLRPVNVKALEGSTIAVKIASPSHSLAWRAYVGVSDQRPNKSSSLSKWVGLSGILGPRHGFDDAVSLLPELMSGVAGGISGDWKSVGQAAVNMITSVWSGVKKKQVAAQAVVGMFVDAFNANLWLEPANSSKVANVPIYGKVLNLAVDDRIYIPIDAEHWDPSQSSSGMPSTKPNP